MSESRSADARVEQGVPTSSNGSGADDIAMMRDALQHRVSDTSTPSGSRARFAAATRSVIDELMRSTAGDDDFETAAGLIAQARDLLRSRPHERSYAGIAEGSLAEGSLADGIRNSRQNFVDFSPFIGLLNPLSPPIDIAFDDDNTVIATCTYGAAYEGPPGCVHGGFIAAGFDEVLGVAQAYSGRPGMTGNLNISYRSPTPLFREVRYVGRLDRVEGRKIYCSATLSVGDRLCAVAEGLFISLKPKVLDRLLDERTDPSVATAAEPTEPST